MTPVPEQGASSRTRSKPPMILGKARASWEEMMVFFAPRRWMLPIRALARFLLLSLAKRMPGECQRWSKHVKLRYMRGIPVFFINAAM